MEEPFSISPNPHFLYLTPSLKTTLIKVKYAIDHRQGLTAILGDVGMGKSSIVRKLFGEYVSREDVKAGLIPSPGFATEFAFLKGICKEFDVPFKRSQLDQEDVLRGFLIDLYTENKNCVVFIDEAQRLTGKQLEQVRTMLNFETDNAKLIQVVLSGQLELRDKLRDESKKAIRSRIFAPSLLDPLTHAETNEMIDFRCDQAGIENPFNQKVIEEIYKRTGGVPREVLKVCGLAYGFMQGLGLSEISTDLIEDAFYHQLEVV
jgi:general secretion pathway protein A